jgi:stage V sporulation protein R
MMDETANHGNRIRSFMEQHGEETVENFIDSCLSLENLIDIHSPFIKRRDDHSRYDFNNDDSQERVAVAKFQSKDYMESFVNPPAVLKEAAKQREAERQKSKQFPEQPERDILLFLREHAPLQPWQRDVLSIVRDEAYYFAPQGQTKIMNEGWASYWHARLLREASFIPQQAYVDAIKCHSDVVRPVAAEQQVALNINPYHLGFSMWEKIVESQGLDAARAIMEQDDDFGFIRNHLTRELAEELGLFRFNARSDGQVKVLETDLNGLHEAVLSPKYNFGAPMVSASHIRNDGTLELTHDNSVDGRGLDLERSRKVLDYVQKVWRRPIVLTTVNQAGSTLELTAP